MPMARYCQLARSQNMRHSSVFYLQFTLENFLYNPWTDFNRLWLKERKVTAATVAESFSGNEKYGSAPITQIVRTAIRSPMAVMKIIREFAALENQQMFPESERLNKYDGKPSKGLATVGDCRPYVKFIHSSSRKSATDFLTGASEYHETAQGNIIHHCPSVC